MALNATHHQQYLCTYAALVSEYHQWLLPLQHELSDGQMSGVPLAEEPGLASPPSQTGVAHPPLSPSASSTAPVVLHRPPSTVLALKQTISSLQAALQALLDQLQKKASSTTMQRVLQAFRKDDPVAEQWAAVSKVADKLRELMQAQTLMYASQLRKKQDLMMREQQGGKQRQEMLLKESQQNAQQLAFITALMLQQVGQQHCDINSAAVSVAVSPRGTVSVEMVDVSTAAEGVPHTPLEATAEQDPFLMALVHQLREELAQAQTNEGVLQQQLEKAQAGEAMLTVTVQGLRTELDRAVGEQQRLRESLQLAALKSQQTDTCGGSVDKTTTAFIQALPLVHILPLADPKAAAAAAPQKDARRKASKPVASSTSASSAASGSAGADHTSFTRRTCPVCSVSYQHDAELYPQAIPRLLQCAHTMCTTCTTATLQKALTAGHPFVSCLVCQEPSVIARGTTPPVAVALTELIQKMGAVSHSGATLCGECGEQPATVQCEQCLDRECGPLCRACFDVLHPERVKAKRGHAAMPYDASVALRCKLHKKDITHFCKVEHCWSPLCATCIQLGAHSGAGHKVVALEPFVKEYVADIQKGGAAKAARHSVDTLCTVNKGWLQQAHAAQQDARESHMQLAQHFVQLIHVLQDKAKVRRRCACCSESEVQPPWMHCSFWFLLFCVPVVRQTYIGRGIDRRAAVSLLICRMDTLLEALEAALKGSAVTLLRVTPTIMRQLNALCEEVALQEQDLKQLALAVYSPAVRGMPARQRALVTQLEDLSNAPAADVMGKLVGTLGPHGSGECERPLGVAVSGGLLYVADRGNSRVQVFNTETREFVCAIGQYGKGSGEFKSPHGVAVSGGLLYVADCDNSRVQVFNTETREFVCAIGQSGNGSGEFKSPHGVAVSGGLLYVADCGNNRVQVFNTETREFVCAIGQSCDGGSSALKGPRGLAVSGGLLYVTNEHGMVVFRA